MLGSSSRSSANAATSLPAGSRDATWSLPSPFMGLRAKSRL